MFLATFFTIQLVMKSAVNVDHCTFLGRRRPNCTFPLVDVDQTAVFYLVDVDRLPFSIG